MADWDDAIIETGGNNFKDNGDANIEQGRSFGKGRGFVPKRISDDNSGSYNNRSDFGGRGRGGRGGRGRDGRGGRFGNEGNHGDGGSGSESWGSNKDNERFDNDRSGQGGTGWGSSDFGTRSDDRGENRRGRGGGRGRGGRRGSNDDGGSGGNDSWVSGNKRGDDNDGDEESEKKREPVTYVPEDRTEEELLSDTGIQKGLNFDDYEDIEVNVTGENKPPPIKSFSEAQFRELIMTNLKKIKYDKPTPIQKHAIPVIMAGRDLMATAQTGSGKTAAFLLPIINRLLSDQADRNANGNSTSPQALILSPTRELAIQIKDNARLYTSQSVLRVEILYGGVSTRHQSTRILGGCNILIATPGRLMDFVNRGYVKFDAIQFVVLDEADRMLDMGFVGEIDRIMGHETMVSQNERQTLMFSATFSTDIQRLAAKYLRRDYIFVAVGIIGGACKDVEQNFLSVDHREKRSKLIALLEEQGDNVDGTLLFVEQKRIADFLASFLSEKGYRTTSIHGDRQQIQREEALRDFKSKRMSLLVATNVAARGLDISGVRHVINFDLPKEIDEYVHRIGRTGRLGNKGKATSFYESSKDSALANNLVRILKQANQSVPDFIQQDATGQGDYENGAFGGYDYRKDDDGFKTDARNEPVMDREKEEW